MDYNKSKIKRNKSRSFFLEKIIFIKFFLKKINKLANLYDFKIDRLDAYVGGMLEADGNGPGELFSAIIKDQFLRLRESDRFWFENRQNG